MCKKLFVVLLLLGVILPTTARATVARQFDPCNVSLIGYWKMDDGPGATSAYDSSKFHTHTAIVYDTNAIGQFDFDATNSGFGKYFGDANWTAPLLTATKDANSQNAKIRIKNPGGGSYPMQTAQGTVALWAKLASDSPRSITANRFMIGFRATTTINYNRVQLFCNAKGNEACVGLGQDNQLEKYTKKLDVSTWYHLALTWQWTASISGGAAYDGVYTLYIDGVDQAGGLMSTGMLPGHFRNMSTQMATTGDIGGTGGNGSQTREGWYGLLDEVGLYDNSQSREQICLWAGADPNKAWNPVPDDNEGDPNMANTPGTGHSFVAIDAPLTWSKGKFATSHDVYLGTDKTRITDATTSYPECKSKAQAGTSYATGGLVPTTVYYWRIDEQLSGTGTPNPAGGNVWKFRTAGATGSFLPDTNSTDINQDVTLSWTVGGSITSHDVFFGTSKTRVTSATANTTTWPEFKGNQSKTTTTYVPFNPVTNGKFSYDYYWKIDEKAELVYPGPTWHLTTADFFTLDDFEYATTGDLQAKWVTSVGGLLSRVRDYSTTDPTFIDSPTTMNMNVNNTTGTFYSGVKRTYTTAFDCTWAGLVKTMSVWYKCNSNSKMLQVKLGDSNTVPRIATATLDPNKDSKWHEWIIVLDDINNTPPKMNLAQMKSIEVGDGNGVHPTGTGNDHLWIDEIRLYKPRFLNLQNGDINGDGIVNYKDIDAMGPPQWLATPINLASNPDFAGGVDSNNIPLGWEQRYTISGTSFPRGDPGIPFDVNVIATEGNPKTPAGRVILDSPQTQGGAGGSLIKTINVTSYIGQTLEISFKYKGDITIISPTTTTSADQVNAFFEYRMWQDDSAETPPTGEGGPYFTREAQLGTGFRAFDWKSYTHTKEITNGYLHLNFLLTGRGDPCTGAHPRFVIIDHACVKVPGSSLPTADLNEDTEVSFGDFVVAAQNWLAVTYQCPPDCD